MDIRPYVRVVTPLTPGCNHAVIGYNNKRSIMYTNWATQTNIFSTQNRNAVILTKFSTLPYIVEQEVVTVMRTSLAVMKISSILLHRHFRECCVGPFYSNWWPESGRFWSKCKTTVFWLRVFSIAFKLVRPLYSTESPSRVSWSWSYFSEHHGLLTTTA